MSSPPPGTHRGAESESPGAVSAGGERRRQSASHRRPSVAAGKGKGPRATTNASQLGSIASLAFLEASAKELGAVEEALSPEGACDLEAGLRKVAITLFRDLDRDGDGTISVNEATAIFGADDQWQFILDGADTNGDGVISEAEWVVYVLTMGREEGIDVGIEAIEQMQEELREALDADGESSALSASSSRGASLDTTPASARGPPPPAGATRNQRIESVQLDPAIIAESLASRPSKLIDADAAAQLRAEVADLAAERDSVRAAFTQPAKPPPGRAAESFLVRSERAAVRDQLRAAHTDPNNVTTSARATARARARRRASESVGKSGVESPTGKSQRKSFAQSKGPPPPSSARRASAAATTNSNSASMLVAARRTPLNSPGASMGGQSPPPPTVTRLTIDADLPPGRIGRLKRPPSLSRMSLEPVTPRSAAFVAEHFTSKGVKRGASGSLNSPSWGDTKDVPVLSEGGEEAERLIARIAELEREKDILSRSLAVEREGRAKAAAELGAARAETAAAAAALRTVEALGGKLQKQTSDADRKHGAALAAMQARIDALLLRPDERARRQDALIAKLRRDSLAVITTIEKKHSAAKLETKTLSRRMSMAHLGAVSKMEKEHAADAKAAEARHRGVLRMRRRAAKEEQQVKSELAAMQATHDEIVSELESRHETVKANGVGALKAYRATANAENVRLEVSLQAALEDAKAERSEAMKHRASLDGAQWRTTSSRDGEFISVAEHEAALKTALDDKAQIWEEHSEAKVKHDAVVRDRDQAIASLGVARETAAAAAASRTQMDADAAASARSEREQHHEEREKWQRHRVEIMVRLDDAVRERDSAVTALVVAEARAAAAVKTGEDAHTTARAQATEVASAFAELATARGELNAHSRLVEQHGASVEAIEARHSAKLAAEIEWHRTHSSTQLQSAMDSVQMRHDTKLESLEAAHAAQRQNEEERLQVRLNESLSELKSQHGSAITALHGEHAEALQSAYDSHTESTRARIEAGAAQAVRSATLSHHIKVDEMETLIKDQRSIAKALESKHAKASAGAAAKASAHDAAQREMKRAHREECSALETVVAEHAEACANACSALEQTQRLVEETTISTRTEHEEKVKGMREEYEAALQDRSTAALKLKAEYAEAHAQLELATAELALHPSALASAVNEHGEEWRARLESSEASATKRETDRVKSVQQRFAWQARREADTMEARLQAQIAAAEDESKQRIMALVDELLSQDEKQLDLVKSVEGQEEQFAKELAALQMVLEDTHAEHAQTAQATRESHAQDLAMHEVQACLHAVVMSVTQRSRHEESLVLQRDGLRAGHRAETERFLEEHAERALSELERAHSKHEVLHAEHAARHAEILEEQRTELEGMHATRLSQLADTGTELAASRVASHVDELLRYKEEHAEIKAAHETVLVDAREAAQLHASEAAASLSGLEAEHAESVAKHEAELRALCAQHAAALNMHAEEAGVQELHSHTLHTTALEQTAAEHARAIEILTEAQATSSIEVRNQHELALRSAASEAEDMLALLGAEQDAQKCAQLAGLVDSAVSSALEQAASAVGHRWEAVKAMEEAEDALKDRISEHHKATKAADAVTLALRHELLAESTLASEHAATVTQLTALMNDAEKIATAATDRANLLLEENGVIIAMRDEAVESHANDIVAHREAHTTRVGEWAEEHATALAAHTADAMSRHSIAKEIHEEALAGAEAEHEQLAALHAKMLESSRTEALALLARLESKEQRIEAHLSDAAVTARDFDAIVAEQGSSERRLEAMAAILEQRERVRDELRSEASEVHQAHEAAIADLARAHSTARLNDAEVHTQRQLAAQRKQDVEHLEAMGELRAHHEEALGHAKISAAAEASEAAARLESALREEHEAELASMEEMAAAKAREGSLEVAALESVQREHEQRHSAQETMHHEQTLAANLTLEAATERHAKREAGFETHIALVKVEVEIQSAKELGAVEEAALAHAAAIEREFRKEFQAYQATAAALQLRTEDEKNSETAALALAEAEIAVLRSANARLSEMEHRTSERHAHDIAALQASHATELALTEERGVSLLREMSFSAELVAINEGARLDSALGSSLVMQGAQELRRMGFESPSPTFEYVGRLSRSPSPTREGGHLALTSAPPPHAVSTPVVRQKGAARDGLRRVSVFERALIEDVSGKKKDGEGKEELRRGSRTLWGSGRGYKYAEL